MDELKKQHADLQRSIEMIPDLEDKEISRAIVVLLAALEVGPDAERLTQETGYPRAFIDGIVTHMQEAELWNNELVDDREWWDAQVTHGQVALGRVKRKKTASCYLYTDAQTGEVCGDWHDRDPTA